MFIQTGESKAEVNEVFVQATSHGPEADNSSRGDEEKEKLRR